MYFIASSEAVFYVVLGFIDFIQLCNIIKNFSCVVLQLRYFYNSAVELILDETKYIPSRYIIFALNFNKNNYASLNG